MATSHSNEILPPAEFPSLNPRDHGKLEIDGHRLYWERYGLAQDPCVLLLHHGLGSIRSWRRQIPAFVAAGWQVVVFDRWGYGRSDRREEFEHAYLVNDRDEAFRLLDALGVEQLALVGHSDGGSIALLMACEQPQRISAMVVVAAHIYVEPKMEAGLDLIAQMGTNAAFLAGLKREHGDRTEDLIHAWLKHWRSAGTQSLSMRDRLLEIRCPTLVIQGELDEHATPQHAIDIANGVQQGSLWLIPSVKHMPAHEIPEVFNQHVLEFLADSIT